METNTTCIVGLVWKDKVIIGGDSAGVSGLDISVRLDEKVFKNGPMIFGFTSSFRMGQLLRYSLKIPKQPKSMCDDQFMTTKFIDAVRKCLSSGGFGTSSKGGIFLVGYKGNLYKVDSDFQVGQNVKSFSAVGCGGHYSTGALDILTNKSLVKQPTNIEDAKDIVYFALQAAARNSGGVCGPFNMVVL